jgi:dolichol-phosphate mannosyltransferase
VIDVDLQDPPELIKELYAKVSQGYDVVYAKRKSRKGETILKKVVSYWAYYLINKISDVRIPRNTGDFRIMTRRVIEQLRILNETHGFLRGLVSFVGFKQTFVEYDRDQRLSGQGKYNRFIGSLKVGINGLISFSSVPLTFILGMGFCLFSISLILIILRVMLGNNFFAVFSMTDFVILLLSSVQLISLGILGEYIGRIYDEVKRRPMYIIDRQVNFDQQA